WKDPGDEMRFLRFMGLSYDCAKARAPYESPRGDVANQGGENMPDIYKQDPSAVARAKPPPSRSTEKSWPHFRPSAVDFCGSRLAIGAATERARALAMPAGTRAKPYKRDSGSLRKNLETEPLSSQMRVEFWRWIELWSLRSAVDYAATSLGMRI